MNTRGLHTLETDVLIIGGGATGAGIMRDLALRGIDSILIDQRDLNAGASGGNHGLLHSGGRYVSADTETAAECHQEAEILKRVAPHCIEECGGMFVAVEGDDEAFVADFPDNCRGAGVPCAELSPDEARAREPSLPDTVIVAYAVPDATVDPFGLVLEMVDHALHLTESTYLPHTGVDAFEVEMDEIRSVLCRDLKTGAETRIIARQVVNAAGAWAMDVARRAGCEDVNLIYSKGTLLGEQHTDQQWRDQPPARTR